MGGIQHVYYCTDIERDFKGGNGHLGKKVLRWGRVGESGGRRDQVLQPRTHPLGTSSPRFKNIQEPGPVRDCSSHALWDHDFVVPASAS